MKYDTDAGVDLTFLYSCIRSLLARLFSRTFEQILACFGRSVFSARKVGEVGVPAAV